jgi:hypothetical protein
MQRGCALWFMLPRSWVPRSCGGLGVQLAKQRLTRSRTRLTFIGQVIVAPLLGALGTATARPLGAHAQPQSVPRAQFQPTAAQVSYSQVSRSFRQT